MTATTFEIDSFCCNETEMMERFEASAPSGFNECVPLAVAGAKVAQADEEQTETIRFYEREEWPVSVASFAVTCASCGTLPGLSPLCRCGLPLTMRG
jgi:hypothetical protein